MNRVHGSPRELRGLLLGRGRQWTDGCTNSASFFSRRRRPRNVDGREALSGAFSVIFSAGARGTEGSLHPPPPCCAKPDLAVPSRLSLSLLLLAPQALTALSPARVPSAPRVIHTRSGSCPAQVAVFDRRRAVSHAVIRRRCARAQTARARCSCALRTPARPAPAARARPPSGGRTPD